MGNCFCIVHFCVLFLTPPMKLRNILFPFSLSFSGQFVVKPESNTEQVRHLCQRKGAHRMLEPTDSETQKGVSCVATAGHQPELCEAHVRCWLD